jgi:hypothetical protein
MPPFLGNPPKSGAFHDLGQQRPVGTNLRRLSGIRDMGGLSMLITRPEPCLIPRASPGRRVSAARGKESNESAPGTQYTTRITI